MNISSLDSPLRLRIGAMAKQSGLAVGTLRTWENRYAAFSPDKTSGRHRMYRAQDLQKAILLKHLCEIGHSISQIAALPLAELLQMSQQPSSQVVLTAHSLFSDQGLRLAVIGLGMASRIESKKFTLGFLATRLKVTDVFFDVGAALHAELSPPPDLWLIKASSLQDSDLALLDQLKARHPMARSIVIYNYAPQSVLQALKQAGWVLRREPLADDELAQLMASVTQANAPAAMPILPTQAAIAPRKFSEQTLVRVAGMASNVLCECPKHVAELINQLTSFEHYSQQCLSKSPQDTALHTYLSEVSGTARNLFEQALERVAAHEGIDLRET
jgi:MerR family transcriptional regulator, light-induced transcriptional regulator